MRQWLLVAASTGSSSTLRVFVWRRLRELGGLYLQQQVCLLPDLPQVRSVVEEVVARVVSDGETARVLPVAITDVAEERSLVAEFNAEREDEYGELVARIPELLDELDGERARGRVTFTEADESRADLERFERWLERIDGRDYFEAPARAAALEAVERARRSLARFEADAADAELGTNGDAAGT